jgi:hypothetical protein
MSCHGITNLNLTLDLHGIVLFSGMSCRWTQQQRRGNSQRPI